jgi:FkbM family methyltransferase
MDMNGCKALIRWLLNTVANRHRINDSALYHAYLQFAYPHHVQVKRAEKRFYEQLLCGTDRKLIFDIGANVGSKTAIFREISEKVIAVEPTPALADLLRKRFARKNNIVVEPTGVSSTPGMARLHVFKDSDSYNTFSPVWVETLNSSNKALGSTIIDVPTTTLDQLIREHGLPSYIKIDVEGHEREVIKGLSVEIPVLSFEANLSVFLSETLECIAILGERWREAVFNYVTKDPPTAFVGSTWCTSTQMSALAKNSRLPYMEIYFRSRQRWLPEHNNPF